jgi:protein-disulfide isomerase
MRSINLVLCALGLAAGLVIGTAPIRAAAQAAVEPAPSEEAGPDLDYGIGRPDAPVRVVEFFSFSCPHCARFHRELLPWLLERYVEPGRVLFVARDFPLNLAALKGAQAARCGGAGRYFELVDLLWREWDIWIGEEDVTPPLVRLLTANGFKRHQAEECLADGNEIERAVLLLMRSALRHYGLDRTPTFLINDRVLAGLPGRETLREAIEEELAAVEDARR